MHLVYVTEFNHDKGSRFNRKRWEQTFASVAERSMNEAGLVYDAENDEIREAARGDGRNVFPVQFTVYAPDDGATTIYPPGQWSYAGSSLRYKGTDRAFADAWEDAQNAALKAAEKAGGGKSSGARKSSRKVKANPSGWTVVVVGRGDPLASYAAATLDDALELAMPDDGDPIAVYRNVEAPDAGSARLPKFYRKAKAERGRYEYPGD